MGYVAEGKCTEDALPAATTGHHRSSSKYFGGFEIIERLRQTQKNVEVLYFNRLPCGVFRSDQVGELFVRHR